MSMHDQTPADPLSDEQALIDRLPPRPEIGRLPSPPPRWAIRLALGVNRVMTRLTDLLTPAPLAGLRRAYGVGGTVLMGAAARLHIADHLAGGPLTAAELAARTGVHADPLHRMMRGLVTQGLFSLDADGRFANNRL